VSAALAQSPAKKDEASQDFAREGVVIEQCATRVAFKSDGTSRRTSTLEFEYEPTGEYS
jgi:hypothetical protein